MSSNAPPPRPASIAIVDDEPRVRERVEAILGARGHKVTALDSATRLLEVVRRVPVDLVLLDVMLEGMSGVEAMRLLKAQTRDFLPVVLLTARTDPESRAEGLRLGADDYVGKPFDDRELVARVEAMLRIKRRMDDETGTHRRLAEASLTDEATGLWNARYLNARLVEELQRAARHHDPLALAVLSLTSAPAGVARDAEAARESVARDGAQDVILREVGTRVRSAIRVGDLVARFGAAELVMLLPTTHVAGAIEVVERVLAAIAARPVEAGGRRLDVRATAGLGVFPARGVTSRETLLRAADTAARRAEAEGAGTLCVHQDQTWVVERGR